MQRLLRLVLRLVLWLGLPFAVAAAARADPPPSGDAAIEVPPIEEAPARTPEQRDAPVDVLRFLEELEEQMAEHRVPPERTHVDRALYDAWRAILLPRADRMVRRVRDVRKATAFELVRGGPSTVRLREDKVTPTMRGLVSLYAELAGALEQYERFEIRLVANPRLYPAQYGPTVGGPYPLRYRPHGVRVYAGFGGLLAYENDWWARSAVHRPAWRDAYRWQWDWANRVYYDWAYWWRRRAYWQERVKATQDMVKRIQLGLEGQQQTLALQMLAVRSLASALQAEEEERLRGRVAGLPEGPVRTEAGRLADALWLARIEAEGHRGRPAEYGTVVRRDWLGTHRRLVGLLGTTGAGGGD
jgi:hypothetical protein